VLTFTGESVDGKKLWDYHKSLICHLSEKKVMVTALLFDFGPSNQAMCKELGIKADKTCINVTVPHPGDASKVLVLSTDPPHGLKGLKRMLLSYNMKVPEW
jgi:hypothetical protein